MVFKLVSIEPGYDHPTRFTMSISQSLRGNNFHLLPKEGGCEQLMEGNTSEIPISQ